MYDPWENYLACLWLAVPVCKMGIVSLAQSCEDYEKIHVKCLEYRQALINYM